MGKPIYRKNFSNREIIQKNYEATEQLCCNHWLVGSSAGGAIHRFLLEPA
jgi:hypothetical protein